MVKYCWWRHGHKLWRHNLYFKKTSSKLEPYLLKQSLKTKEKLKELQIKYQNAIYICISLYSKICWFSVKKCWCKDVSPDTYTFWISFRQSMTVPSFIIVGYVWQILGRGGTFGPQTPPSLSSMSRPEKPILNRLNGMLIMSTVFSIKSFVQMSQRVFLL